MKFALLALLAAAGVVSARDARQIVQLPTSGSFVGFNQTQDKWIHTCEEHGHQGKEAGYKNVMTYYVFEHVKGHNREAQVDCIFTYSQNGKTKSIDETNSVIKQLGLRRQAGNPPASSHKRSHSHSLTHSHSHSSVSTHSPHFTTRPHTSHSHSSAKSTATGKKVGQDYRQTVIVKKGGFPGFAEQFDAACNHEAYGAFKNVSRADTKVNEVIERVGTTRAKIACVYSTKSTPTKVKDNTSHLIKQLHLKRA